MRSLGSGIVLVACLAISFTLDGCEGCKNQGVQSPNTPQAATLSDPKPTRILSKLPDYFNAWYGEKSEDALLLKYSPQYAAAFQLITAKTNGIADPQLRSTAISDEWSHYDEKARASWLDEARANFKQHQSKFLSANADKLFEIGRVGFVQRPFEYIGNAVLGDGIGDNDCNPESRDGFAWTTNSAGERLLELCRGVTPLIFNPVAIKLPIASLDGILRQFDSLSAADVQVCVNALYAQNRDTVEKEIADSGMPRDQAMAQAMEEGRQSCLKQQRENLRVFAQGDLVHQQFTKLLIMDYQTEDVLLELPSSSIVALKDVGLGWDAPTETGVCREESSVGLYCK